MNFENKRKQELENNALRVYYDDDGKKKAVFLDRKASFAIVRHTKLGTPNPDGMFVPLVPRHMTSENWRNLFWLDTKLLVINGEIHKDICGICRHALRCISKGKNSSYSFKCVASPETMMVKLTTRKKGEPACPR